MYVTLAHVMWSRPVSIGWEMVLFQEGSASLKQQLKRRNTLIGKREWSILLYAIGDNGGDGGSGIDGPDRNSGGAAGDGSGSGCGSESGCSNCDSNGGWWEC